jgi:group I intron endonuclease
MHTCPNGKKYIGITSQAPERRWQKGKGYAYGSNPYFYNAIEKYGWDNIEHTILFRNLTKDEAEEKEIELIKEHKTSQREYGYNIDLGGFSCGKHSEEYKIRMSNMQKEIWERMPERRIAMSKLRSGTHLSEETKEKLRQANLGKKYSKEVVQKRIDKMKGVKRPQTSKILKEMWASGKIKGNTGKTTSEKQKAAARENAKIANEYSKKPILMFDKEGNFIAEYESAVKAAEAIGNPHVHISDVCYGRRKSSCGYVFKFKEV